ncbi:hypothetical protein GQ54DRAFT_261779 [Martensiomyces pterosporus]|nr:hypothetical protein GQ54DRAFT_261779 [Martensiomyces pterosporus]
MPAALASARRPEQLGLHSTSPCAAADPADTRVGDAPPASLTAGGKPLIVHLKALHQKASRALILGQGSVAWSHCREAIQYCSIESLTCEYGEQQARQLCCRLWILYICVLSSLTELAAEDGRLQVKRSAARDASTGALQKFPATVRDVWDMIMTAFGGYAGNVDSEVLVPTVLLCLKLRDAKTARDIVEAWLATLSDETMYLLQGSSNSSVAGAVSSQQHSTMVQASYLRVCELYTLHILPQLDDFASAYEFLDMCTVVSATTRDGFVKRLDSLRNPTPTRKQAKSRPKKKSAKPKTSKSALACADQPNSPTAEKPCETGKAPTAAFIANSNSGKSQTAAAHPATENGTSGTSGTSGTASQSSTLPSLASVYAKSGRSSGSGSRARSRPGVKTRALVRKPRSTASIAWQVVRRLMSRWGFTLFTLAIIAAVLRMLTQRFRLPPLLSLITKKLWNTVKMGTQVTYI